MRNRCWRPDSDSKLALVQCWINFKVDMILDTVIKDFGITSKSNWILQFSGHQFRLVSSRSLAWILVKAFFLSFYFQPAKMIHNSETYGSKIHKGKLLLTNHLPEEGLVATSQRAHTAKGPPNKGPSQRRTHCKIIAFWLDSFDLSF